jgi:HAD superfamily phosphoserine phosphatase-like hydrolase
VKTKSAKHFLLASDFDQTLSFNDSGFELSELLGVHDFEHKVAGLARSHLVQQGGELAYLIRHDPAYRGVRREHLAEAGRRVRLKGGLRSFVEFLERGIEGCRFSFYVVSAAPREVVVSALDGIVPPEHIFATEFDYDDTGEVRSINRVRAGYGKVAVLDELAQRAEVTPDRIIYVGDGSSDIHVMLHVNNGDGFTIAVSENRQLARIARSTVLSDNAGSVLVPILDQLLGLRTAEIRTLLESTGLALDDWQRDRTDRVQIRELALAAAV